ncbi:MAG: hypothetical protein E7515_08185 [Ruminococcaceae bacterium]|jgi:hypothetical protein|nr:hypothetical protein [Oscillospiraceae bacterium]
MFNFDLNVKNCNLFEYNGHEDYLVLIDALQKCSEYVVIVQVHGEIDENDKHILKAKQSMELIEKRSVTEHCGTKTLGEANEKYVFKRIDGNADFFKYLKGYNSFFDSDKLPKIKGNRNYQPFIKQNFGIDDICFLDENKKVLFFTVTHEHMSFIDNDFLNRVFH